MTTVIKKKTRYPLLKISTLLKNKAQFNNIENIFKLHNLNDLSNLSEQTDSRLFKNSNKTYKFFTSFANSQAISTDSKGLRKFLSIRPTSSTFNHNLNLNTTAAYLNYINKTASADHFFFFNLSSTN
jgi:hypothetical protein